MENTICEFKYEKVCNLDETTIVSNYVKIIPVREIIIQIYDLVVKSGKIGKCITSKLKKFYNPMIINNFRIYSLTKSIEIREITCKDKDCIVKIIPNNKVINLRNYKENKSAVKSFLTLLINSILKENEDIEIFNLNYFKSKKIKIESIQF